MQGIVTIYRVLFIVLVATILSACSVKKYIPEGEQLFTGGKVTVIDSVKTKNKSALEYELQSLLYPEPNTKFLGFYPGLRYHYKSQKEKTNFIVRYMNKKIGEKPVYYSDVNYKNTKELIENRLENNGFFKSEISSEIIKDSTSKTIETNYTITIEKPYVLNQYILEVDSLENLDSFPVYEQIEQSLSESLLKNGSRYNLNAFKTERERIDLYLKSRGYYNFNSSFLLFQADTNLNNNNSYNLYIKLKDGVPAKAKVPYLLNKIKIYPSLINDTTVISQDATIINNKEYIQNTLFFSPKRLDPFVLLKSGTYFDPIKSKYTSQRISSIGTYKFVNISYTEIDSLNTDSLLIRYLDATISLSPMTKRSIRAELQGVTKSNNFTGPNLGITYLNRNVFKGGENFSANANFGYEKQLGNNTNGSSSLQFGLNSSLIFPRLIFPGNLNSFFKYSIPKTKINVGLDYFNRSKLYSLTSYSSSFGYLWNANSYVSHQLNPIKINYLQLGNKSAIFSSILDANPYLKRSFEQQFIAGLSYSFMYNDLSNSKKKGRYNIKFNFEVAGNTLSLLGTTKGSDTTKSFLGLAYAQYIKGDLDLSYHYKIKKSGHSLVGRVFGGIGIPYANSATLPYVKQYFSGGSYSVRAFQIRGLGPGIYNPADESNLYFDRSGDIRLEGNFEYRFPLISYLKGALFADAGNIWNLNDNLPGGKFTTNFIQQFGVGTGFGLRLDVQGFVVRLDLATPLKRPSTTWDFEYKNPVLNFAIGYPF